jgi:hypothetical protein
VLVAELRAPITSPQRHACTQALDTKQERRQRTSPPFSSHGSPAALAALVASIMVDGVDLPAIGGGALAWVVVWFVLGYAIYAMAYGAARLAVPGDGTVRHARSHRSRRHRMAGAAACHGQQRRPARIRRHGGR